MQQAVGVGCSVQLQRLTGQPFWWLPGFSGWQQAGHHTCRSCAAWLDAVLGSLAGPVFLLTHAHTMPLPFTTSSSATSTSLPASHTPTPPPYNRQIPDNITKPDYYLTGYPASEMESRQQHAGVHGGTAGRWPQLLSDRQGCRAPRCERQAAGGTSLSSLPTCVPSYRPLWSPRSQTFRASAKASTKLPHSSLPLHTQSRSAMRRVKGIRTACATPFPYSNTASPSLPSNTAVKVRTEKDVKGIRTACAIGREVLDAAAAAIAPGVTTDEIDRIVRWAGGQRGTGAGGGAAAVCRLGCSLHGGPATFTPPTHLANCAGARRHDCGWGLPLTLQLLQLPQVSLCFPPNLCSVFPCCPSCCFPSYFPSIQLPLLSAALHSWQLPSRQLCFLLALALWLPRCCVLCCRVAPPCPVSPPGLVPCSAHRQPPPPPLPSPPPPALCADLCALASTNPSCTCQCPDPCVQVCVHLHQRDHLPRHPRQVRAGLGWRGGVWRGGKRG